jgi:hypothetical protein
MAGGGTAAVWMLLIGLMSDTTRGYFWLTVVGSLAAWLGALVLARFGDRGAAVGRSGHRHGPVGGGRDVLAGSRWPF